MSISLAFSTAICPEKSTPQVIDLAKELGYTHVELITTSAEYPTVASDPLVSDPQQLALMLQDADIKPACLHLDVCLHHADQALIRKAYLRVEHACRVARTIGCPYVRLQGNAVKPNQSRVSVISRMVANVLPMVKMAADHGVILVFENNGSFAKSKDWWTVLNMVEHPMLGICWNPTNAHAVDELPAISIPVLHSRIHMVRLNDLASGSENDFVPIGQGKLPVRDVIHRLMGIGFNRILSVGYDQAWLSADVDLSTFLADAKETLTSWMQESAKAIEDAQVKIDKLAARNAPKPRQRAS